MFELKKLSPRGVERALDKVERYRLLNEPWEAESICRDVLETDPANQDALVSLVLAMTDQLDQERAPSVSDIQALLPRLEGEYQQEYYGGIVCERKGTSILKQGAAGCGPLVYDWLRKAMAHFERAEELAPPENEDAVVRWNTCARLIMTHDHVQEVGESRRVTFLE